MVRPVFCLVILGSIAARVAADDQVDYARQVKPIFSRRCFGCHGALKQRAGLRLDSAEFIRKGGAGGPAIAPGKSAESLLIEAITGTNDVQRMPPSDEGEPLDPTEIAILKSWIDQGAVAPPDDKPQADPRKHWAFQRVQRPAVPGSRNGAWIRNPIDAFIAEQHVARKLEPSPPADRSTLLRRIYLDLTGLPPPRDVLRAFLADTSEDAYERVVDRLLDSPQYGERWARHWMDVWRYSDWYGRRAVPDPWNSAPQIWRWRDWIVRSLNEDKGYDRMVVEMLAADEIAPEDDANSVATGFIIRNWYALNPHQWMKDMVEHTGKAFLGLTMNCAHCHDHKYDPLSNDEYFQFRAFFEPVQVRQDRVPGEPDPGPFQKYEYAVLRKVMNQGLVRIFDENPQAETRVYRQGDERALVEGKPPVTPAAPAFLGGDKLTIEPVALPARAYYPGLKPFIRQAELETRAQAAATARPAIEQAQQTLVAALRQLTEIEEQRLQAVKSGPADGGQAQVLDPRLIDRRTAAETALRSAQGAARLAEARMATAVADLDSFRARIAADDVRYLGVAGDADQLAKSASRAERTASLRLAEEKKLQADEALAAARFKADVLTAGAEKDQAVAAVRTAEQQAATAGPPVEAARQALTADSTAYTPISPIYPAHSTGRRRALARWIAQRDNPLTARVAINQIWMRHMGRALVETVFDLGVNGKPPTHPELLDWLAAELMDESATAGSAADQATGSWRMKHIHRLIVTSNAYRQRSATGTDHPNLAGDPDNRWLWHFIPRRIEAEVLRDALLHSAGQLDLSPGGQPIENDQELVSRRRSLYFSIHPEDGGHPRFLELFDAPDPCDCYRRTESLVPQQALALANGPIALQQSRLLARTLWAETVPVGNEPSARETAFIAAAFEQILSRSPTAAEQTACREFFAKQVLLFRQTDRQQLAGPEVAGVVRPAVDPVERACENLVHALFSHHDFVTIR